MELSIEAGPVGSVLQPILRYPMYLWQKRLPLTPAQQRERTEDYLDELELIMDFIHQKPGRYPEDSNSHVLPPEPPARFDERRRLDRLANKKRYGKKPWRTKRR